MYKRQGANWQIDAVTDRFTRSNKHAIEITQALNTRCNGRHMVLRVDQHQFIDRAIPVFVMSMVPRIESPTLNVESTSEKLLYSTLE